MKFFAFSAVTSVLLFSLQANGQSSVSSGAIISSSSVTGGSSGSSTFITSFTLTANSDSSTISSETSIGTAVTTSVQSSSTLGVVNSTSTQFPVPSDPSLSSPAGEDSAGATTPAFPTNTPSLDLPPVGNVTDTAMNSDNTDPAFNSAMTIGKGVQGLAALVFIGLSILL